MKLQGVIFDLDGVITDTAHLHFQAWQQIAAEIGISIDAQFNESLKGISRDESLRRILQYGGKEGDFNSQERAQLALSLIHIFVLITYADQFHSNDLKPLPIFNQFYHQWLQSIFSHVHLLPFYPWSSDDGFSVIDYHQVASEAGEWQDIQQLGECSHLMFDFVCNHMSAKSEWFKNYLQQQPGFEDFFIAVDPQTDLSAVTRPRALPLLTPFQMAVSYTHLDVYKRQIPDRVLVTLTRG